MYGEIADKSVLRGVGGTGFVEFRVDLGGMDVNFAALCLTSPFCRAPEMDALAPKVFHSLRDDLGLHPLC